MIRLGIIGVESAHTKSILRMTEGREDVKITAVWGETPELTKKVLELFSLDCGVDSIEEMIGKVDGVMITLRDGAKHLQAAYPFLGHSVAIWVDKPFTASVEDARELLKRFAECETPFSGGSFMKFTAGVQAVKNQFEQMNKQCMSGYMSFWTKLDSPYSGMHFYSHHLIESVLESFGTDIRTVYAKRCGESVMVTAGYDRFVVVMNYGVNMFPVYGGVFGLDMSFMTEIEYGDAEKIQLEEFLNVIRTGKSPYPPEFFLTAVKVSNAIIQSLDCGQEVEV